MRLTCESCGTEFDADRETATAGIDTSRCPACGTSHDVGDGVGEATIDLGGATVRVTVEIEPAG